MHHGTCSGILCVGGVSLLFWFGLFLDHQVVVLRTQHKVQLLFVAFVLVDLRHVCIGF